jgi:organic hydroperoxide reductase OsmC/OhrA
VPALYTASATATGRNDPKEMDGPGGATNPEQMFAAEVAADRRQTFDTNVD